MSYVVFLHDEDGGNRGELEGDTIADCLRQLNNLDGSDAMDRGCCWLGADTIVSENGKEIPIYFGNDCKYSLTRGT